MIEITSENAGYYEGRHLAVGDVIEPVDPGFARLLVIKRLAKYVNVPAKKKAEAKPAPTKRTTKAEEKR